MTNRAVNFSRTSSIAVFGEVENVFDRHYATYGSFTGLGRQVGEIAQQEGKHVIDVSFDISLASELVADFCTPSPVGTDPHRTVELLLHPQALAGTSDGGAHMRFFSGGYRPTELLIWLVRESGVISLEETPIAFLISPRAWRA